MRRHARSCTIRFVPWSARWCWSVRGGGARMISPPPWRRATAPPAVRLRRRRAFICSASTIDVAWGRGGAPMISRRIVFACIMACAIGSAAKAQNYPGGQVRMVVPFPAGGATDVLGRVVSAQLQNLWGQTVIPEYRPGAAGLLGARQVIGSPADGSTLLLASMGAVLSVASSQSGTGTPEVTRELAPISLVAAPP